MSVESNTEFMKHYRTADPFIQIADEIDQAVASLRVVWLALQSKEWLDNNHIGYCADCLDRAVVALEVPRAVAAEMAKGIVETALGTEVGVS